MVEQIIKIRSDYRFEECLERMNAPDNGLILKHGSEETLLKCRDFSVNAFEHFGIEAKFIAKVLKEQANVVPRGSRDGINACSIKPLLSEGRFCRIQNRLACFLRITSSSSFTSWLRHAVLISLSDLTND